MRARLSRVARGLIPNALQAGGIACVAIGFGLLAVWLGLVVGGLALCFLGWAYDRTGEGE